MSQNEELTRSLELFTWAANELPIRFFGDAVLKTICTPIADHEFESEEVRQIADELTTTLTRYREKTGLGRGLAANQIGYTRRIIAVLLGDEVQIMCNPTLESSEGMGSYGESCISSGALIIGEVHRPWTGIFRYNALDGREQLLEANEKETRLMLHELDHLNGTTCDQRYEPGTMKLVTGGPSEILGYQFRKLAA